MRRRDFLRNSVPAAALLPAVVDGYSVKAFTGQSPLLQALMDPTIDTDHVLVIIQLSGGNDGLRAHIGGVSQVTVPRIGPVIILCLPA